MRIVHIVQRYVPAIGGAETHVRAVAEEQARRGHEVTVVTTGERREEARLGGVRVVRFPTRHWRGDYLFPPWLPMPGARAFIEDAKPDLIHAHSYRFATIEVGAQASRAISVPLIVTAHGFYPPESGIVSASRALYDRLRGKRALAQAARCVAVTSHEIDHYARLGVERARIDVVPNGLPESAFVPGDGAAFRKRHSLEGPIVLFLARLAHDKGVRDLARAAALVPDATFAFCGRDAGEEKALRSLAGPNVRVLGPVDEPRDAYAACDIFCLPSHYEAFGIVLAEAMAQTRPVVSTRAGGIPDVVGEAGVLVAPRDPRALAEAIQTLLANARRRRELGEIGCERAKRYRWTSVVDELEEVYRRAAAALG